MNRSCILDGGHGGRPFTSQLAKVSDPGVCRGCHGCQGPVSTVTERTGAVWGWEPEREQRRRKGGARGPWDDPMVSSWDPAGSQLSPDRAPTPGLDAAFVTTQVWSRVPFQAPCLSLLLCKGGWTDVPKAHAPLGVSAVLCSRTQAGCPAGPTWVTTLPPECHPVHCPMEISQNGDLWELKLPGRVPRPQQGCACPWGSPPGSRGRGGPELQRSPPRPSVLAVVTSLLGLGHAAAQRPDTGSQDEEKRLRESSEGKLPARPQSTSQRAKWAQVPGEQGPSGKV